MIKEEKNQINLKITKISGSDNIPELRFPEFVNEGEWVHKTLDELIDLLSGYAFQSLYFSEQGQKLITPKNFTKEGYAIFNDENTKYTTEISDNKYWCEEGDLLVLITDLTSTCELLGKPVLLGKQDGKVLLNQRIIKVIPKGKILVQFLLQFFLTDGYHNRIKSTATGSTVRHSSNRIILDSNIFLPITLEEQKKIASCLSSLDEVIAAHSQKLELLKDHKKGLMQNLFPQSRLNCDSFDWNDENDLKNQGNQINHKNHGSDNLPKYRFKEFEKDGEWVEKKLGEVCKFVRGPFGGALKKEIFVSSGFAVYEQSHAIYNNLKEFRYYINEEKFQELRRFAVNAGNIIMSCSGTMGKFAIIPDNFKKGVINQALLKLEVKKEFSVDFLKLILELPVNQEQILSQAGGGAIKNVASVSILQEIKIEIPKLKEQQKIASCLSSLDALIAAQAEKIEQLKLHKKGLMQGLFPKTV